MSASSFWELEVFNISGNLVCFIGEMADPLNATVLLHSRFACDLACAHPEVTVACGAADPTAACERDVVGGLLAHTQRSSCLVEPLSYNLRVETEHRHAACTCIFLCSPPYDEHQGVMVYIRAWWRPKQMAGLSSTAPCTALPPYS